MQAQGMKPLGVRVDVAVDDISAEDMLGIWIRVA